MTRRDWLVCAGWAAVGVAIGLVLLVISAVVLTPIAIYPAVVIGTAPFLALIFWLAWLVTQRVRNRLSRKTVALLVGALLPLIVVAADTIVQTPQAIMFVSR